MTSKAIAGHPAARHLVTSVQQVRRTSGAGLLALLVTLGCGTSNAERPYADGAAPQPSGRAGSGGSPVSVDGGATGSGGSHATGGAGGTIDAGAAGGAGGGAGQVGDTGAAGLADGATGADAVAATVDASLPACAPQPGPACDAPPPPAPDRRAWRSFGSGIVAVGGARHRGHDLFVTPEGPQWLIARFAYGLFDAGIPGEEVDIFLLRGCGSSWESLGTAILTGNGEHAEVEGVPDPGSRVFFSLPEARRLGPGRHRVRFVVAGDGSSTELFVEVRAPGTVLAVVDVDGTLTTSETAEFGALLTGQLPTAQADAAKALGALAARGYPLLYLTARPEWLTGRTREFLSAAGFPSGIIETTTGGSGALGADAVKFKTDALARITGKGLRPTLAIGNTETDADAYAAAKIEPPPSRIFLRYSDQAHGGRRIEAFADVIDEFGRLPCR